MTKGTKAIIERFSIGINYSKSKQEKLKKFCSIINIPVCIFTGQALDNEMDAVMEQMEAGKRKAVEALLKDSGL